jgi:hypothetical protein
MGEKECSLLLRSSRTVGVSLAQQYLGEQGGIAKLDQAMNPTGGAKVSALNCGTIPGLQLLGDERSKPLRESAPCGAACGVLLVTGRENLPVTRLCSTT